MNNTCRILVWEDENLQWLANIANRLAIIKPKWTLTFTQKDSDYPLNKEPGLMDGWETLRSINRSSDNEFEINFEIYHSRGIEGENFSQVPIILTDIRLKNDYKADTKKLLGHAAPDINNEEKSRYGIKVLGKKAVKNNPNIILIVASDYIANLDERIHLIQEVGGNALNIYEKKALKDNSSSESIAWHDCVVQQIISVVTQWSKQQELEEAIKEQKALVDATNKELQKEISKNESIKKEILLGKGDQMLGDSETMQKVYHEIYLLATSKITQNIFITGESGTGKELVAKRLHELGDRNNKPFVPVNITALPSTLIESELFGHKKGAFTGAVEDRKGLFEQANGGVLFMDEVGDLPIETQPKLLRVLQEKIVIPVGSSVSIPVDVQVISASKHNLNEMVQNKTFRDDLYFRLNANWPVVLPPLRNRGNDIQILIEHFVSHLSDSFEEEFILNAAVKKTLLNYAWPGNVRELEETIKGIYSRHKNGELTLSDLPPSIKNSSSYPGSDNPVAINATLWTCPDTKIQININDVKSAQKWLGDILDGRKKKIAPGWIYWQPQNKMISQNKIEEYGLPQSLEFSVAFIYIWWAKVHESGSKDVRKSSYGKVFGDKPDHEKIWQKSKRLLRHVSRQRGETLNLHESDLIKNGNLLLDWLNKLF